MKCDGNLSPGATVYAGGMRVTWSGERHEHVRARKDRSTTGELLELLGDVSISFEQRVACEQTLADLEDPRSIVPLLARAEDPRADDVVRDSAVSVLAEFHHAGVDRQSVREWLRSNDPHLRRLAFARADREHRVIIAELLENPFLSSGDRIACLSATSLGYEEPGWQQRKIAALKDSDPAVRACAANVLLWDEPIAAEHPLIDALDDDDDDVALAALDTLRYFPSMRVLRALWAESRLDGRSLDEAVAVDLADAAGSQRLGSGGSDSRTKTARNSLKHLVDDFQRAFMALPSGAWPDDGWLDRCALLAEELELDLGLHQRRSTNSPAVDALATLQPVAGTNTLRRSVRDWTRLRDALLEPDGEWSEVHEQLPRLDASAIPHDQRDAAIELLGTHPDAQVRMIATGLLAELQAEGALLELAEDPSVIVAKCAIFALHDVSPSDSVARHVHRLLDSQTIAGTRGSEALRTWARHAESVSPKHFVDELLSFTSDLRESVRCEAVEQCVARDLIGARSRCLVLLETEPLVTWAVHTTILSGHRHLGIEAGAALAALSRGGHDTADNLWLQAAIQEVRGLLGT